MKLALKFTLLAFIAFPGWEVEAQIQDDDSSASLLAMQCAMSSGRPPSNYEEYCHKLAKTVALLEPKQQERVFGYLPRPSVVASGDLNGYGLNSAPSGASGQTTTNPLVALVGEFNDSMDPDNSSGAIIGGTPPVDPEIEPEPAANEESNWWGGILGWLGEKVKELVEEKGG